MWTAPVMACGTDPVNLTPTTYKYECANCHGWVHWEYTTDDTPPTIRHHCTILKDGGPWA